MNFWPNWNEQKFYAITLGLFMIILIIFVGSQTINSVRSGMMLGDPDPSERTIFVEGEATVIAAPDIATITLGVESSAETVALAQAENTTTTNALLVAVKAAGIPDDDIQTQNYNVYEDEEWNPETFEWNTNGWIVSQSIEVTVRNTDLVAAVIVAGGDNGATNIYGPQFSIDDTGAYLEEARTEAITDARKKAQEIADALDLDLGEIVDYSEWISGGDDYRTFSYGEGMGGVAEEAVSIEEGTEEINMSVTVTYQLR